jgi:hypothetical protein
MAAAPIQKMLGLKNLNFPGGGHIGKWRRGQFKNKNYNLGFKNLNFPRGGHIGKWRPAPSCLARK